MTSTLLGLILAGGSHDESIPYQELAACADVVICADGGANAAYRYGIRPDYLIGDMDSIEPEVLEYFRLRQVIVNTYPADKDFTDTQLAINLALELKINEIIFLGTFGGRFDHAFSNLFSSIKAVEQGVRVVHKASGMTVYIIRDRVSITGSRDDIVSIFSLTACSSGVTTKGLRYPLQQAALRYDEPYAVSNCFSADAAEVTVEEGILAVFHLG